MQHSSQLVFCDTCGAANEPATTECMACQQPLVYTSPSLQSSSLLAAQENVLPSTMHGVVSDAMGTPANVREVADLSPGTVLLGRYQIRQEIGRGGFSVVYLTRDLRTRHLLVTIKRISLHRLTPRQILDATETYNREIKMLSSLKAVIGVPRFYGSFTDPEHWYLIRQYIPGQTLEDHLAQAPGGYLPENSVVEIGAQLTDILQKLHAPAWRTLFHGVTSQCIIFRDLKPANIMITPNGNLYLIDFGIARFFTPGQKKDTTPLGSPGYAPPEQYGRAQTDERADIYSLGATLQTLFTGCDPVELAQGEPSRNPKQPSPHFRQLLDHMLAPERYHRPRTMKQVQKRLLESEPLRRRVSLSFRAYHYPEVKKS